MKKLLLLLFLLNLVGFAQSTEAPKLPAGLTDAETQLIRKEASPKGYIEAATRVAETRLARSFKLATENPDAAIKDLELYFELMVYADEHTRYLNLSPKERNKVLKVIEQSIFKQQRHLEGTRQQLPLEAREQTEKHVETIKRIRLRAINDILGNGEIIK